MESSSTRSGKETTRQSLLDAGKVLFESRGYEAASTDEIARKAGVSKGTVYFYFRQKEDLFLAVVERELERIGRLAHDSLAVSAAPSEALLGATELLLSGRWPLKDLVQVMQSMWVHAPGRLREKLSNALKKVYGDHRKIAKHVLEEAGLPSQLRKVDREALAYLLLGCVEGLWRQALVEGNRFPHKKVLEALGVVFFGRSR